MLKPTFKLLMAIRHLNSLDLPSSLRRRIRSSYVKSIYLRGTANGNTAEVAGYQVKFCTFHNFRLLFNEMFINQEYSFESATDAPFILDCGSNIGMSVLYFKLMYPKAEVVAFEPDADAFRCLSENVRANSLDGVTLVNKAVAASDGPITFYYDPQDPGSVMMSTRPERMSKQEKSVEAVRLSTFVDRDVDFLKLDVEGAEQAVLQDLKDAGVLGRVKQMAIEFHHHVSPEEDCLSRLLALLENANFGYQIQSPLRRPLTGRQFQDVLIYAYQKARK